LVCPILFHRLELATMNVQNVLNLSSVFITATKPTMLGKDLLQCLCNALKYDDDDDDDDDDTAVTVSKIGGSHNHKYS